MTRATRRPRPRTRRRRAARSGLWLLIGMAAGAATVLALRPRSLPPPPLGRPRFTVPRPARAPSADSLSSQSSAGDAAIRDPLAALPSGRQRDASSGEGRAAATARGAPVFAPARVAIVIDDLGDSLAVGRTVLALEPRVTAAILPFREASTRIAALAVTRGSEVILHLPLEPDERRDMVGARGFLETGMSAGDIDRQLNADLRAVPYIVGVNGHMGSRFTSDPAHMEMLLRALRAQGLFFLDSRTTGTSVAAATAARVGVPFAERTLFIDHDPSPAAVSAALTQLTTVARAHGTAIAIGHPHPATIAALREWLAGADQRGITVVPASALVR